MVRKTTNEELESKNINLSSALYFLKRQLYYLEFITQNLQLLQLRQFRLVHQILLRLQIPLHL